MKTNVGSLDRTLRALIGLVPLATAGFRICPPHTLLGLNTSPVKKA